MVYVLGFFFLLFLLRSFPLLCSLAAFPIWQTHEFEEWKLFNRREEARAKAVSFSQNLFFFTFAFSFLFSTVSKSPNYMAKLICERKTGIEG